MCLQRWSRGKRRGKCRAGQQRYGLPFSVGSDDPEEFETLTGTIQFEEAPESSGAPSATGTIGTQPVYISASPRTAHTRLPRTVTECHIAPVSCIPARTAKLGARSEHVRIVDPRV